MITPMLVQAYGAAAVITAGSVVLGRAICVLCGGRERWWAAPLVGLASFLIITSAAIKLPGRAVTSAVITSVVLLAAAAYLMRGGRARVPAGHVVVGFVALLAASIPFVANGRVGVLGAPWDNDMAVHLLIAEALRTPRIGHYYPIPPGYPLGPHSLVATLGTGGGLRLDAVFIGLQLATVALTALAAAGVVAAEALWRRLLAGVLCALTYLVAAYFAEGSFKEPIVAGLLLAFVLHLEQVQARWPEASRRARFLLVVPAAVLGVGAVYTFSYLGAAWFAAALAVWLVLEVVARPNPARAWASRERIAAAGPWVVASVVVVVILLLPIASLVRTTIENFGLSPAATGSFAVGDNGNLPGPLSPFEALGVWTNQDFRYLANTFHQGEGAILAVAVLALGLLWSLRRRELLLPASVMGSALIYWYARRTQSSYVAAKALVIPAPVFMAVGLRALLTRWSPDRVATALLLAVAALFCGLAAYSSYLTLRTEPVRAPEPGRELAAFHSVTGDAKILFLGIDDFAAWDLRDSEVYSLASAYSVSASGVLTNPAKPFDGRALDFDSVTPLDLDRFRYVVTTNTPYASQAPSNFRLLERRRLYDLWQRTGPTVPLGIVDPPGQPGAVLDCRTRLGRQLRDSSGVASVMTTPVLAPGASLSAGQTGAMSLALPTGRWEISAEYLSYFNLEFRADGKHWQMPAYLGRNGPWFAVGEVTGRGMHRPVTVTATAQQPSPLTGGEVTAVSIYQLAGTAVPDTRRVVPLRGACGKYVDFYRLP